MSEIAELPHREEAAYAYHILECFFFLSFRNAVKWGSRKKGYLYQLYFRNIFFVVMSAISMGCKITSLPKI
jgi:hypothetical protein